MAQASHQSPMNGRPESSSAIAIAIPRNDDVVTRAFRDEAAFDIDRIAHLQQAVSPDHGILSSPDSRGTSAFSSQDESTVTKPTSIGTTHQGFTRKGKGKAKVVYSSSLSAAHGSGSELEARRHAARAAAQGDAVLGAGDWVPPEANVEETLKGAGRAKRWARRHGLPRQKKPAVHVSQRTFFANDAHGSGSRLLVAAVAPCLDREPTNTCKVVAQPVNTSIRAAEEGRPTMAILSHKGLSPTRRYLVVVLASLIMLTIALATYGAYSTGKGRMGCTKGIVFGGTIMVAVTSLVAMVVAGRSIQEGLLACLVEVVVGFALVLELGDFM